MYNLSSNDLKNIKKIGSGTFGTIYLKDNKILKIYHERIKVYNNMLGMTITTPNPCLNSSKIKYGYLKSRNNKLFYTDLIDDTLFIDGVFSGVVMPYYDGETLKNHIDDPIENKISILRQLLRNAKELTDNHIYPLDYKENNLILNQEELKIIDLDDKLTKILNPMYKRKSIINLDDVIKRFIGDIDYNSYVDINKKNIEKFVTKKESINDTYKKINEYLQNIIKRNNYIILDENININNHIEIFRNPSYRIVYVYDLKSNLEKDLMELLKLNIQIYTILPKKKLKNFLSSVMYEDLLTIKENNIVKVKK